MAASGRLSGCVGGQKVQNPGVHRIVRLALAGHLVGLHIVKDHDVARPQLREEIVGDVVDRDHHRARAPQALHRPRVGALRRGDDAARDDRLGGSADPRPVTEPSIRVEASHGRGRTGGGASRRRGGRGWPDARVGSSRARSGAAAGPQDAGGRGAQGGAGRCTGNKSRVAAAVAAWGSSR